jgi:hypothetical protein
MVRVKSRSRIVDIGGVMLVSCDFLFALFLNISFPLSLNSSKETSKGETMVALEENLILIILK